MGCLVYGWLADRIGYARALLVGALGLLLCSYALYLDLRAGAAHFVGAVCAGRFQRGRGRRWCRR